MTWRRVTDADIPALVAILRDNISGAMFPLDNLNTYGLDGDAPRAMRFWISGDSALGLSNEGMVMPVTPDLPAHRGGAHWDGLIPSLRGEPVKGVIGATHAVHGFRDAAQLTDAPAHMDTDEPGFRLRLADLDVPDCAGLTLSPITDALQPTICAWRAAYEVEAIGNRPDAAQAIAQTAVASYRAKDSHRVLLRDGVPVAMTGFNARIDDIVQIGGVYTPPELRRQGLARRAVALHLIEARDQGATLALLFAATDNAARAYRAIGFAPNGGFTLFLLSAPVAIP